MANIFDILKPFGRRASVEDMGLYVLPQEFVPRNATIVDQTRSVLVPIAGSAVAGFNYRVPSNRRGVMRMLAVDTFDPAGIPYVTFSVTRSGAPIPNYQLNAIPFGTIGQPTWAVGQFDGDQVFDVTLQNSSVTQGYQAYVRAILWFWDVVMDWGR